jgi:hypothetical protein
MVTPAGTPLNVAFNRLAEFANPDIELFVPFTVKSDSVLYMVPSCV